MDTTVAHCIGHLVVGRERYVHNFSMNISNSLHPRRFQVIRLVKETGSPVERIQVVPGSTRTCIVSKLWPFEGTVVLCSETRFFARCGTNGRTSMFVCVCLYVYQRCFHLSAIYTVSQCPSSNGCCRGRTKGRKQVMP